MQRYERLTEPYEYAIRTFHKVLFLNKDLCFALHFYEADAIWQIKTPVS